ncbi:MAG: diacylglycerol kinase (ATP) [Ulvibacter sp.]
MITKIHFIVNPIAGSGKNRLSEDELNSLFRSDLYEVVIKESQFSKHAIVLAKESIAEKADVIVACGGDGTINEVASCLINTNVTLGIIPMGSGNGLASNLKIPKKIEEALKTIKKASVLEIDAGLINDEFFFSNTGIGFDAHVISDFEKDSKRKLWGYVNSAIKSLRNYKYQEVELTYSNQTRKINPFLLFISNSNEMGYKMSLTPKASLQDGLFDIIIVPKLSAFKMICFTLLFLLKKHYWLRDVKIEKAESFTIKNNGQTSLKVQKDGESLDLSAKTIEIKVLPKALKICAS